MVWNVTVFLPKTGGSTAVCLLMFYWKPSIKNVIKKGTTENKKNRKFINIHQKSNVLKNSKSQRYTDYSGFVKSRFSRECSATEFFVSNLSGKVRFGVPFWDPVDFEGGPKITFLGIMFPKNEKKEVQERFQKNIKFRWIFDAEIGGAGER